jgi:UbiD family decarboxylase
MAILSFRDLIAWLEAEKRLARVARAVDPKHELVAVMRKTQLGPNCGLVFEAVTGSPMRVATNIMSRSETLAAALGVAPDRLLPELAAREGRALAPEIVEAAPVQEVVIGCDALDVGRDIPQVVHSERDAGAYITAGIFLARHPETGVYNASYNRTQLVGGDRTRVRMMPPQHLGQYQAAAEAKGAALPAAIVIGAPPALMLAAASKIPYEADELAVAGAWQGAPLRVVPAKTAPLLVPAEAEMVIEGEVLASIREEEGPFGEFMDAYVEVGRNHVFQVSAITRRRDAIYHVIHAGGTEDLSLLSLMLRMEVWKRAAPLARVRDVGMPGQILGCVVSIEKTRDDEAAAVMRAALAAHPWMKFVVVVDDDVNPHDATEVMWAIHTRFTPDSGLLRIEGASGFPRADVAGLHRGKLALDATYPVAMKESFRRRRLPGFDAIDLADYLGKRFRA